MRYKITTYTDKGLELISREYEATNDDDKTFENIQSIQEDSEKLLCEECEGHGLIDMGGEPDDDNTVTCGRCGGDGLKEVNEF